MTAVPLLLPPRYSADEAARRCQRRRPANLYGLIRSRPVKQAPDGTVLSIELIWMPCYACRFQVTRGAKRNSVWISVDGSYGGSALSERVKELRQETPEGEIFPYTIDEERAEALAREGIIRFILRKRGAKPKVEALEEMQRYHAPFWVYYARRTNGKIDLSILDAYTGEFTGGGIRQAVINGLVVKHRAKPGQNP